MKTVSPEYITDKNCAARYGTSRATWWRWVRNGHAPKPVKLAANTTRWKIADLTQWEAEKELAH
jgi:predicted DNA-binding transcriptional regulator AlpA